VGLYSLYTVLDALSDQAMNTRLFR